MKNYSSVYLLNIVSYKFEVGLIRIYKVVNHYVIHDNLLVARDH